MKNYWKQLNLPPNASKEDILSAWNALPLSMQSPQLRLFVKANLDPYYCTTLKYYPNLEQLLPAGFFDDTLPVGINIHDISLFTTPLDKIINNINKIQKDIQNGKMIDKPYLILLNTGSYSPIHIGHLQMMEEARKLLQNNYHIIGGYLSPSHDNYVSSKYGGQAAYNSEARISLCQEVIQESSWLMVDPWESRYNNVSINFTDVITRLKLYLKKYLNLEIEIGYVFGSDNAGFTWAFIEQGISICFERPGYELQYQTLLSDCNIDPARHFFINHKNNIYSSNAIRQGKHNFLPERIKKLYFDYKEGQYPVDSNVYLVRDDGNLCTPHLKEHVNNKNLNQALYIFKDKLKNNIRDAFKQAKISKHMEVYYLSVEQQNSYINSEVFDKSKLLNIDLWTKRPGQASLGISRIFNMADGQIYSNELIQRPGSPSIEKQLSIITEGNYTLVDDDIASGHTVKMIKELLPNNIKIEHLIALSQQSFHQTFGFDLSYHFHDIIDLRDFIIGSTHGGLVVRLPNETFGRIPYILPYVSLIHRAKIPYDTQWDFNLSIISLNYDFYKSLSYEFKIKDMDQYFIQSCLYLGFDKEMTILDFCLYHLNSLKKP